MATKKKTETVPKKDKEVKAEKIITRLNYNTRRALFGCFFKRPVTQ